MIVTTNAVFQADEHNSVSGLKGNAAKLHRWFSRSRKNVIETSFISRVLCGHRALSM